MRCRWIGEERRREAATAELQIDFVKKKLSSTGNIAVVLCKTIFRSFHRLKNRVGMDL